MTDDEPMVPDAEEGAVPEPAAEAESVPEAGPEVEAPAPEPQSPVAPPPPPPPPPAPEPPLLAPLTEVLPEPPTDSDKVFAVLGYVSGVVALVALFIEPYKDRRFVRLHAVQALGIWVIAVFAWIPVMGWLLGLTAFVLAVIGIVNAFQGKYFEIPLLYDVLRGFIEQE